MRKIYRLFVINLCVLISFLIFAEIVTRVSIYLYLGNSSAGLNERQQNLNYQPFTMFGPNWYKLFLNYKRDPNKFVIMIIGGSAANGFPNEFIREKISKKINKEVDIINTGSGGYNAKQSYIILSMFGPKIKPDLIISFDGGNDIIHSLITNEPGTFYLNSTYELYLTKPLLSPFIWILQNSQLYNSINRISSRSQNFEIKDYYEFIDDYIQTQKNIINFSNYLDAKYISILQPFSIFKNPIHENEKLNYNYQYRDKIVKDIHIMIDKKLTNIHKDSINSYYLNGADFFKNEPRWIFSDDVHFKNNIGYEIVVDNINKTIEKIF